MGRKPFFRGRAGRLSVVAALVLAAGLVSVPIITSAAAAAPAAALETDTYSWPSAPCAWTGATTDQCVNPSDPNNTSDWYDWGVTSCPSGDANCASTLNGYIRYDPWGYEFRTSTSYVAEKISQEFSGRSVAGWGQASNWRRAARNAGYTLDSSPHVGDIAGWTAYDAPPFGQVAYVYAVNNGVASYDQYNADQDGTFSSSYTDNVGPYGSADWFIHMGTPAGTSPSPSPSSPSPTPTSMSPSPTPSATSPSPTPTGTSTSSGGPTAWVVTQEGVFIPINTATNTEGPVEPLGGVWTGWAAIAPNGQSAYTGSQSLAGPGGYFVSAFNLVTGTSENINPPITADNTTDAAYAPNGQTVYLVDPTAGAVIPVNTATNTAGTPIPVGSNPGYIAITPDGQTAYVTLQSSSSVVPVNLATGAVGAAIPVGGTPGNLAITRDGATVWAENQSAGTLVPVSTATNTAGTPIPFGTVSGDYAGPFAITPDGATAYVLADGTPNKTSAVLVRVNLTTGTLGAGINVGPGPNNIAITPDGTTAYVTDYGYPTSSVVPVNLATNNPGTAIPLGSNSQYAFFIAITP